MVTLPVPQTNMLDIFPNMDQVVRVGIFYCQTDATASI